MFPRVSPVLGLLLVAIVPSENLIWQEVSTASEVAGQGNKMRKSG